MKQKRKIHRCLYLVIGVICFLLLIGGSYLVYAAMTAQDRKENDFQVGQVETRIFEENFDETMTEIPKDQSIPKEVRIENTGTIRQFVRVMVLPEVRKSIVGDAENEQVLPLPIDTSIELEGMETTDWIDGGDGYYYYNKRLDSGDRTSYLFESVRLPEQLSDRYHQTTLTISLKVETINCAQFAYRDAWWQGNTPEADSPLEAVDEALKALIEN
ncbi:hypothetical protein [Candidatus Enterococcus ferrettii]|uniref:Alternate signal-mediated exported protein, CPF_0494 family n=1 Tax=Candidatus Enterococcus ferrettii TaxID=2815324 RepID=A0ABV0EPW9_9ENTE|nr:hypothetical protein [Enterococcus sp. 665A]MBO1339800.1 hypothetical protein [Enterococcus sp. 665A]